jgi:Zn-dependent peptidase ImmA (M78 family)
VTPSPTPIPPQLLSHVRQLAPKRALTFSESLTVAQHQAGRLRELLDIRAAAMPLDWVPDIPKLTVQVVPAYKLGEETSGLTTRQDGRYFIAINKNKSRAHRRFTLCHELKHLIDYPYARILHAGLGHGDPESQEYRIERIADHFAAHLLMPTTLMKRAWGRGLQDPRMLSQVFEVSQEAMRIRLDNLGLTGDDELPAATYFRRSSIELAYLSLTA